MYVFSHKLDMADYGHYQAFWVQSAVFNAVLGAGLTLLAFTYSTEKALQLLRSLSLRHLLCYAALLLLAIWLYSRLQAAHGIHLPHALGFLLLFALCNMLDALLIVFRQYRLLILFNFLYAVAFLLLHLYFLRGDFALNALLLRLIPLLAFKALITGVVVFRSLQRKPSESFQDLSEAVAPATSPSLKSMRSLWLHLYLYDIIQVSFVYMDKFVVTLLRDPKQVAIYVNGALNIPVLPLLFSALASGALLHLSVNSTRAARLQIVNQVGRVLSSVAFPLFLFFIAFGGEFLTVFFSEKYLASLPVFMCAILILPFKAYSYTVILQHLEKGKIINLGAILDLLLALLLMYPLYQWLGIRGLALAPVISTVFQAAFYLYYTSKFMQVPLSALLPLRNWWMKMLLFGLLAAILYLTLPGSENPLLTVVIAAVVMGGTGLAVLIRENRRIRQAAQD